MSGERLWGSSTACITCGRTGGHAEWCAEERRRQYEADIAIATRARAGDGRFLGKTLGIRHSEEFSS